MREQEVGLIINISSMAGIRASKMAGVAYSASKHGMVSLTNNINQEECDMMSQAIVNAINSVTNLVKVKLAKG